MSHAVTSDKILLCYLNNKLSNNDNNGYISSSDIMKEFKLLQENSRLYIYPFRRGKQGFISDRLQSDIRELSKQGYIEIKIVEDENLIGISDLGRERAEDTDVPEELKELFNSI